MKLAATSLLAVALLHLAVAQNTKHQTIVKMWTKEKRNAAVSRELLVDPKGEHGYLRLPNGMLQLYGKPTKLTATYPATSKNNRADRRGRDTTPPSISNMSPSDGATIIGSSATFSATVTDSSRIRSVRCIFKPAIGRPTRITMRRTGGDRFAASVTGFTDGDWTWQLVARDAARRRANTAYSPILSFTVDTGSGGDVPNDVYTGDDPVDEAAGRIYFEMPNEDGSWVAYVCSGSVVNDETAGRSIILTAAHCVFDDVNKVFARNVLFIPDQDETTNGDGTDDQCSNDPLGCWTTAIGVVDTDWAIRTFPENIKWDFGLYVVDDDSSSHSPGFMTSDDILDDAVGGGLGVSFAQPDLTGFTTALGYSYDDDPNLMYCAQGMAEYTDYLWLDSCELSGGSSGGPWLQPNVTSGHVVSVNSWGYTDEPGMGGPKLYANSANCMFEFAKSADLSQGGAPDGDQGFEVSGC